MYKVFQKLLRLCVSQKVYKEIILKKYVCSFMYTTGDKIVFHFMYLSNFSNYKFMIKSKNIIFHCLILMYCIVIGQYRYHMEFIYCTFYSYANISDFCIFDTVRTTILYMYFSPQCEDFVIPIWCLYTDLQTVANFSMPDYVLINQQRERCRFGIPVYGPMCILKSLAYQNRKYI